MDKNKLKHFIANNKYLSDKKYHKGLGFSQIILGGGSCCITCGDSGAEHSITHDRKSNGKYIHSGNICFFCCKIIQKGLDKSYWDRVNK